MINMQSWLQCIKPRPESQHRLICFPHAGGAASFFRAWGAKIENCEIYAVRYPGRAERIDEPLPTDLHQVAFDIAKAIEQISDCPISLFGHSMGAAVALETARALEARGVNVTYLFASGSRHGPCPQRYEQFQEDESSICDQLVKLGGTDPGLLSDPMFLELVLPSVRADGKMFHTYEMQHKPSLQCSVVSIFGDSDVYADIRPWRDLSASGFTDHCVSGDHFYLISNPPFDILDKYLTTSNKITSVFSGAA